MQQYPQHKQRVIIYTAKSMVLLSLLFVCAGLIYISAHFMSRPLKTSGFAVSSPTLPLSSSNAGLEALPEKTAAWTAPQESSIPPGPLGDSIRYGRELIANTAKYFGPQGKIARISNGMNCQNCHLNAGTKPFANNYAVFFANYPKKGARSGKTDQVTDRISDCFQRSLNGKMPDKTGKEVLSMVAYFKWVGQLVQKGEKVVGTATAKLAHLDRPADPAKGQLVYREHCQSCHGTDGAGQKAKDQLTYLYPPLWGKNSYNDGAGMYRLSNFAGFVKNNMPYGIDHNNPVLEDEEAWDVAAYVNSRPRPHRAQEKDYPDLAKKPIDAPYGPYPDHFSEMQHKYGPFKPIIEFGKSTTASMGITRGRQGDHRGQTGG